MASSRKPHPQNPFMADNKVFMHAISNSMLAGFKWLSDRVQYHLLIPNNTRIVALVHLELCSNKPF